MTNLELNDWIAEHVMGWEYRENPHGWRLWFPLGKDKIQQTINHADLPDFCHDLNACARAEKRIGKMGGLAYGEKLRKLYAEALETILNTLREDPWPSAWENNRYVDYAEIFHGITATARQRCEAMYEIRDHVDQARAEQGRQ